MENNVKNLYSLDKNIISLIKDGFCYMIINKNYSYLFSENFTIVRLISHHNQIFQQIKDMIVNKKYKIFNEYYVIGEILNTHNTLNFKLEKDFTIYANKIDQSFKDIDSSIADFYCLFSAKHKEFMKDYVLDYNKTFNYDLINKHKNAVKNILDEDAYLEIVENYKYSTAISNNFVVYNCIDV